MPPTPAGRRGQRPPAIALDRAIQLQRTRHPLAQHDELAGVKPRHRPHRPRVLRKCGVRGRAPPRASFGYRRPRRRSVTGSRYPNLVTTYTVRAASTRTPRNRVRRSSAGAACCHSGLGQPRKSASLAQFSRVQRAPQDRRQVLEIPCFCRRGHPAIASGFSQDLRTPQWRPLLGDYTGSQKPRFLE